jgi:hypothetical protein
MCLLFAHLPGIHRLSSKPCKNDCQWRDSLSGWGLVPIELGVWKRHIKNGAFASMGVDLAWVPSELKFGGMSISDIPSMQIPSPYNLSCNLWDKDWVRDGTVLKNMKVGLIGEIFSGASRFGLLVLSYLFGLGSQDGDHSTSVCFHGEGAGRCCHICSTYKLPIVGSMSFFYVEPKNIY